LHRFLEAFVGTLIKEQISHRPAQREDLKGLVPAAGFTPGSDKVMFFVEVVVCVEDVLVVDVVICVQEMPFVKVVVFVEVVHSVVALVFAEAISFCSSWLPRGPQ
jgi:hypothetical protein